MNIKIGILSDLHLVRKTVNLQRAFSKLNDAALILMVGDIADRADTEQYEILLQMMHQELRDMPVYCVSGNHDNPSKDDTNYRLFEKTVNEEYLSIADVCGAFYKHINADVDLIGLNPLYHQKQFYFPDKGRQLTFLQEMLKASSCQFHIVMCHPPLIAHNPGRTTDMASYIVLEQDKRLQTILDENRNVIFLSGHTHVSPVIEFDEVCSNLYINDGSICPTMVKGEHNQNQQGNVTLLTVGTNEVRVVVKGIHKDTILFENRYCFGV